MLCAILSETRQNRIFTVSSQHNIYPVYLYLLTRLGTPAWPLDPRPAAAAWRHSGASSVSDVPPAPAPAPAARRWPALQILHFTLRNLGADSLAWLVKLAPRFYPPGARRCPGEVQVCWQLGVCLLFLMRLSVTKLAGKCFPEFPKVCPPALQCDAAAEYVVLAPVRHRQDPGRGGAVDSRSVQFHSSPELVCLCWWWWWWWWWWWRPRV